VSDALITVEGVEKRFARGGEVPAIEDVSFAVARGELIALIGPSGCGKSTVLNIIAELVEPSAGRVEISEPDLRIAYVFQRPRLLPWRTVIRNVEFGLDQRGGNRSAIRERALRALALVNLEGQEERYPHELSGGMQQRAALARGLAIDPGLFLLDEPFGALDALTRSYLQEELLGIVRDTGTTTLLVTHDIDEALILADRVLVMSSRPGRIKATIEIPFGENREIDHLIADSRYAEIRTQLHQLLRPEIGALAEAA
jgi:ABC-type nitrate/sulfonate/bicarbonate transport system ATPase subunit